jgi:hypothetical protein
MQPWFLDGKLTSNFRNCPHIDGSFLSKPTDFIPESSKQRDVLVFDWTEDAVVGSKGWLDIVEAISPDGIYELLERGKSHAKEMEEDGKFSRLKKKS